MLRGSCLKEWILIPRLHPFDVDHVVGKGGRPPPAAHPLHLGHTVALATQSLWGRGGRPPPPAASAMSEPSAEVCLTDRQLEERMLVRRWQQWKSRRMDMGTQTSLLSAEIQLLIQKRDAVHAAFMEASQAERGLYTQLLTVYRSTAVPQPPQSATTPEASPWAPPPPPPPHTNDVLEPCTT